MARGVDLPHKPKVCLASSGPTGCGKKVAP